MRNTKDAMQIVRFGKTADEPKTRYQQAQEDRLNENFRKMLDLLLAIVNTPLASTPEGPATAAPVMDGTAEVGSSAKYAREDHVHPTDTSRQAAVEVINLIS